MYVGTNFAKFFVETHGEFMEDVSPTRLLNSGGEFKPGFGGWFKFSAGWRNDRELGDKRLVVFDGRSSASLPNQHGESADTQRNRDERKNREHRSYDTDLRPCQTGDLADFIFVVHWGQVIASGTPAELKANKWVQASNLGQLA